MVSSIASLQDPTPSMFLKDVFVGTSTIYETNTITQPCTSHSCTQRHQTNHPQRLKPRLRHCKPLLRRTRQPPFFSSSPWRNRQCPAPPAPSPCLYHELPFRFIINLPLILETMVTSTGCPGSLP